jgi:hypothetical protein
MNKKAATMPRRKSKRLLKLEERFKRNITEYLVSLGARPGHFYDYELDTPAGLLHLTVYENWVATRFDDVDLGRAFTEPTGCNVSNRYSGKWNFHFSEGTTPEAAMPSLGFWLERLMKWNGNGQPHTEMKT